MQVKNAKSLYPGNGVERFRSLHTVAWIASEASGLVAVKETGASAANDDRRAVPVFTYGVFSK